MSIRLSVSQNPSYEYSLQFENGYPRERKFRIPSNASEEARQRYIRDALSELEQNIVTVDSGDVVDADPGWGDPLFFAVDEADVGSGDEDEGIAFPFDYYGKFNGEFALYGGRETNEENQEYGCTIGCTQVPGSDMDNSNYDGSSYETECEISPYGPSDLPTITDWGPDEDNTTYIGNVSVDEISFGADAGGPYGEVTISPSSTDVSAQYDETNFADDGPIKTLYEIEGADEDTVQKLGNPAVFITDPDNTTICDVSLTCAFSEGAGDWPNSETLSENIRRWDLDE
ncbi:hypothetical protein [Natronobacterium lacisalsi]|uniref:hypothetical protein n=1 Tax=Natronobacterium lacisalsi TaxID=229731 RepID=UPI00187DA553|nr:hypothetical protein [Halobiforma lacisalsi]